MKPAAHLSADNLLALAESRGSDPDRRHVDRCAACAATVADLRATLGWVAADDVPEPSPLFWEHLSARIGRAIDDEPLPAVEPWWRRRLVWLPASAAALAMLVLAVSLSYRAGRATVSDGPVGGATGVAAVESPAAIVEPVPARDDETWNVVSVLSADLADDGDEATAFDGRPGTVDRVVEELTAEERGELVRLLEAELARRPS